MHRDEIEKALSGYEMDDVLDTYPLRDIADYLSCNDYYVYRDDPTEGMIHEDEIEYPEVDITEIAYNEMHAGAAKAKDFLTDILGLQHTVPTSKILAKVAELIM